MSVTALAFLAALLAFVAIGVASASRRTSDSTEDYLVAGRDVPAWLAALSSVATNNSGFMFVGLIGYTLVDGVHTAWMALAWIVGDLMAWLGVHRQVRALSGEVSAESVPGFLGWRRGGEDRTVVILTALLTVFFLGGYAAAQLQAGSLALESLFGWHRSVGVLLGGGVVTLYCLAGGLRASIWTDAAQAFVMIGAMGALLMAGVAEVGGPTALLATLEAQDPALVHPWPASTALLGVAWFGGYVAGGFGAIGQPHILIRTMSIRRTEDVPRAAGVYFAWFVPFYAAAVLCALYARALLPELAASTAAAESALPALGELLLPDVLQGILLAGLFAATLSTADSQLLSCSAALTQDLVPQWRRSTLAAKAATLSVACFALLLALFAGGGVFSLVLGAWGMLAVSIGPLVVLRTAGQPATGVRAVVLVALGLGTLWTWNALGLGGAMYGVLPGMALPLLVGWMTAPPAGPADPRAAA